MGTVLSQVVNSKLSKQGKTTTTGIFEGQPENVVVNARGYRVPTNSSQTNPIDVAANKQAPAPTYLDHLKNEKKI